MAEEFANLIKNLWSGQTSFTYANVLRVRFIWSSLSYRYISFFPQEYAAKRHTEFVGNGQHDAQELLTIVLDAIHEVKFLK
jgi:ubiquitin C-terminal hydrolase